MNGDGWDGPGAGSATLFFHIENSSGDLGADQRGAIIFALAIWASVVQIDFVEVAVPNLDNSLDFRWTTGNHCAIESAECGDADCPFDGPGGVIAHAGFSPGGNSLCGGIIGESFAGNVHFDDADLFEADSGSPADGFSLTFVASHEIGHALGLVHDTSPGGPHIMRPSGTFADVAQAPSASDIASIRSGYAAGSGTITTLESTGIWVNSAWGGPETGMPGSPFDTIGEGVAGLPPFHGGVTIHVLGGLYPGPITISQPCTITAEFSTAFIGQ